MPQPKTPKQVSTFLGMVNYFHRFLRHASWAEIPLRALVKEYKWDESHTKAFEAIKKTLAAIPTLRILNGKYPIHVHTDASNVGIGATLIQVENGVERPVQYFSRTLKLAEKNYAAVKKELLAVLKAVICMVDNSKCLRII